MTNRFGKDRLPSLTDQFNFRPKNAFGLFRDTIHTVKGLSWECIIYRKTQYWSSDEKIKVIFYSETLYEKKIDVWKVRQMKTNYWARTKKKTKKNRLWLISNCTCWRSHIWMNKQKEKSWILCICPAQNGKWLFGLQLESGTKSKRKKKKNGQSQPSVSSTVRVRFAVSFRCDRREVVNEL